MSAITTYTDYVAALAALDVTGVKRKFDAPPASIESADLPAMYPGLPHGTEPPWTFKYGGGWPQLVCDLIIATEAVGQGTQPDNFDLTLTMIDNLNIALRAASIGRAGLSWTVTANVQVNIAGTTYWAVIATIEGR